MIETTFLSLVCSEILKTDNASESVCIVPGSRAAFVLKQYFKKNWKDYSKPLPVITSLNEWIQSEFGHSSTDDSKSIIFSIAKKHLPDYPSEKLWMLCDSIVSDFSEINQALVDSHSFFQNLKNYKELDPKLDWSFNEDELGNNQIAYLQFWDKIGHIYHDFEQHQIATNNYSASLINKIFANKISSHEFKTQCYFIGFNAFTQAEQTIINESIVQGKGQVFTDTHTFFSNKANHDTIKFIAKNTDSKLISAEHKNDEFKEFECSGNSEIIIKCVKELKNLAPEDYKNTLLVLANESMALQLLASLEAEKIPYNCPIAFKKHDNDEQRITFLLDLLQSKGKLVNLRDCKKLFKVKANSKNIAQLSKIGKEEFLKWNQLDSISSATNILQFHQNIEHCLDNKEYWLEVFHEIEQQLINLNEENNLELAFLMLREKLNEKNHFVSGNKEEGVQVLGMLETRALDYKFVYILSADESNLPAASIDNSLIPFELRSYYQLASLEQKEAIYAYYFYRLMFRSSTVKFFYNSAPTDVGVQEKSRYLLQIEEEWCKELSIDYTKDQARFTIPSHQRKDLNELTLSTEDKEKLRNNLLFKNLSASKLNILLNCPKNFLFKYVYGIQEPARPELLPANDTGSAVHKLLEDFYTPFLGTELNQNNIKDRLNELNNFEELLFKILSDSKSTNYDLSLRKSYNLSLKILAMQAKKIIDADLSYVSELAKSKKKLILKGLETLCQKPLEINKTPINCKGYIDRIFYIPDDDCLIINDIKTGKVEANELIFTDEYFPELNKSTSIDKLRQANFYYLLSDTLNFNYQNIKISFTTPRENKWLWVKEKTDSKKTEIKAYSTLAPAREEVTKELSAVIEKIISLETVTHNEKAKYCLLCED